MDNVNTQPCDLVNLLVHQVRAAKRYRRFVTLVMLAFDTGFEGAGRALRSTVRECDELFELEDAVFILMAETPPSGARRAIDRYREHLADHNLYCAIASFPEDDKSAMGLFNSAARRMERACELAPGTVVAEG